MTWPLGLAIYFTMWWTVLFAVLPFGVRSQHEGEVTPGTDPAAPMAPRMGRKIVATTILSGLLFTALWAYSTYVG